jgi:serine/threonine-protein kinase
MLTPMGRTYYCARCMHSFTANGEACPNLACRATRPERGWGRLLQAGDLLDRHYRVHNRIAVGGAGITYRARELDDDDEEVGPDLAIKVLLQSDGTFLRRLGNEARVLQELDHAHIVESMGFVHRAGKPAYLVMRYESGGNLFDHVRHVGALPLDVASAITEQILDALVTSHRRGIVHRDLKPQNVLLREVVDRETTPHVLVADFGIAKVAGFLGDGLTTVGTFVGTPEFAAPEQFKGLPPSPASDIYAAICVFWFCLTGEPPVTFGDRSDIVACLTTLREAIPLRLPEAIAVPPAIRARLDELFAHTLVMDAESRWSAGTVLEALASLELEDADVASWASSPPVDAPPMATMSPEALLEPEPQPSVASDPPTPEAPTIAAPAEPAAPPPPAPKPSRMRLRPTAERTRSPEPEPSTSPTADGLDALFESAKTGAVEVANRAMEEENAGSLEDLFADPKPTPPPTSPPPESPREAEPVHAHASGSVLDGAWETVVDTPSPEPPPAEPEPPAAPWVPDAPTPVPASLADDARRLAALGSCGPEAREAVLAGFSDAASAVGSVGNNASPATLCGANLVVAAEGLAGRAAWCRRLLTHEDPDVRATAALAVGTVGKAGQLTQLNRLLSDSSPKVRRATVFALKGLGERTGKQGLVENWLSALSNDPDPSVRAALKGA